MPACADDYNVVRAPELLRLAEHARLPILGGKTDPEQA